MQKTYTYVQSSTKVGESEARCVKTDIWFKSALRPDTGGESYIKRWSATLIRGTIIRGIDDVGVRVVGTGADCVVEIGDNTALTTGSNEGVAGTVGPTARAFGDGGRVVDGNGVLPAIGDKDAVTPIKLAFEKFASATVDPTACSSRERGGVADSNGVLPASGNGGVVNTDDPAPRNSRESSEDVAIFPGDSDVSGEGETSSSFVIFKLQKLPGIASPYSSKTSTGAEFRTKNKLYYKMGSETFYHYNNDFSHFNYILT